MIHHAGKLTPYKEGSVKELWAISYPLILSMLSINIMIFVDRLLLARYDTRAMNAAVVAGFVFSVFQYGAIGIAAIAEVFTGQYNGSQQCSKIGEPVWQMIWFSVLSLFIFIPVGQFAGPLLISNPEYFQDGVPFFKTLMFFGPTFPLATAIASFFVGRGKVKMVMSITIFSNILNVFFDCILIFGVENFIEPQGAKGAAIATGIAQAVQAFLLLGIFLRSRYRRSFGTSKWQFKPKLFWQAFQIGAPNAMSSIVEALAWCALAQMLASVSEAHITIFSIGDSFFALFTFGFWGLQKGMIAVAANFIGANREAMISKTIRSGLKIVFAILVLYVIPMFLFPEWLAKWFFPPDSIANAEIGHYTAIMMRWLWVYFLFEALSWLFCGVLTAAGDTKFVMIMNSLSAWAFCIVPTYFWVTFFEGSPVISWAWCSFYAFMTTLSFYFRYKSKRWINDQPLYALESAE